MFDPIPSWEYRIESAVSLDVLNALGRDGWELVAADDPDETGFVFKRPAQSFVERVTLEQRARYYESLGLAPEKTS